MDERYNYDAYGFRPREFTHEHQLGRLEAVVALHLEGALTPEQFREHWKRHQWFVRAANVSAAIHESRYARRMVAA